MLDKLDNTGKMCKIWSLYFFHIVQVCNIVKHIPKTTVAAYIVSLKNYCI
ncbi:hypothetical protein SAMN05518672_102810 [Chitinophaga sp. CF118]|nr:hypothetical protein SAMN05518672_102810 [Chitinophaga sp. CF118]